MVAIIDYDAGNVKSVEKALQFLGADRAGATGAGGGEAGTGAQRKTPQKKQRRGKGRSPAGGDRPPQGGARQPKGRLPAHARGIRQLQAPHRAGKGAHRRVYQGRFAKTPADLGGQYGCLLYTSRCV